jgi:Metallo-beta-lactamase superfamily
LAGYVDPYLATPGVVNYINTHHDTEVKTFLAYFGDDVALPTSFPAPLDDDFILLEGHKLRVIEVGQGDIAPTAVLHVPAFDAVIAGDVAYNEIHQMLGLGGPAEWEKWIASLDAIERLRPRIVVAGHKKPEARDDEVKILDGSRAYIRDFAEVAGAKESAQEIVEAMQARYPNHGNLTTLVYSARETVKRRSSFQ